MTNTNTPKEWCPDCQRHQPFDSFTTCKCCGASMVVKEGDLVSECCEAPVKNPDDLERVECTECGDNDCGTIELEA